MVHLSLSLSVFVNLVSVYLSPHSIDVKVLPAHALEHSKPQPVGREEEERKI